jgi:16S rRNA A1518/A1519 N6-dimethyltransferase RsmA/KsgA/DIM1 with predicted DNA glycosylase/AP lyase activity|tara:strand:- start:512 stop:1096 length:585 start_codon:yes stop_codon:yes gene_type:complete
MIKKQIGKNYSLNNASGKRNKQDFYQTPYSVTRKFLNLEDFDYNLTFCEPACGKGAIVKVLQENTKNIIAYDIEKDFFKETNQYDYIITNPPYSKANKFIKKAKQVATKKFAMLLPLSYLYGKTRYDEIWTDNNYGLFRIYVLTRSPILTDTVRDDGKYKTGMLVLAWFVFKKDYDLAPLIYWIDNNDDVLRKR